MNFTKRLILVEDNPADAELTIMALAKHNEAVELMHFTDGQSLISHINQNKISDLNLILLDLNMPGMNGFEILSTVRNLPDYQHTPIVIFSSSASEVDIEKGYSLGANAYVTKPFDLEQFNKTVCSISEFWNNNNKVLPGKHNKLP